MVMIRKQSRIVQSLCACALLTLSAAQAMQDRPQMTDQNAVATFTGHEGAGMSVAFNPDGTLLASGASDPTLRVWRVAHGQVQTDNSTVLSRHKGRVNSVAFNAQGTLLAYGSDKGNIRLRPIVDGQAQEVCLALFLDSFRSVFSDHQINEVCSVAFNPQGTLLASGSADGAVRVWRIKNGRIQYNPLVLRGHSGWVNSVTFNSQGTLLVSGSNDCTIRVWRVENGRVQTDNSGILSGYDGCVRSVAFNSQGTLLAAGFADRIIRVWRVVDGQVYEGSPTVLSEHAGCVHSVVFNPQGTLLASGSDDGAVCVWRVVDGQVQTDNPMVFSGHEGSVRSVAFNPQGTLLVSGFVNGTVRVWCVNQVHDASVQTAYENIQVLASGPSAGQNSGDNDSNSDQEASTCFICFGQATEDLPLAPIPCVNQHDGLVHMQCWDRWVVNRHSCPICRENIQNDRSVGVSQNGLSRGCTIL